MAKPRQEAVAVAAVAIAEQAGESRTINETAEVLAARHELPVATIKRLATSLGITLNRKSRNNSPAWRLSAVAKAVLRLYETLGEEPPADLVAVIERKAKQ